MSIIEKVYVKKLLSTFFITIVLLTSLFTICLYAIQEQLIFGHTKLDPRSTIVWNSKIPEYEIKELEIPTADAAISGVSCEKKNPQAILIYFHGKASNLGFKKWEKVTAPFLHAECNVYMMDYRGFGKSTGHMSEQAMLEDCVAVYDYITKKNPNKKVIVYGKSLGTTFATYVAMKRNPDKLILEAPFYNMHDAAQYTMPYLPEFLLKMVNTYPFKTNEWISKVDAPITLFHGDKDTIIDVSASERLYSLVSHNTSNSLYIIPGGGHDNLHKDKTFRKQVENAILSTYSK